MERRVGAFDDFTRGDRPGPTLRRPDHRQRNASPSRSEGRERTRDPANLRVFGFGLDEQDEERLRPYEGGGPVGDVYAAERRQDAPHAAIMRYNLNRDAP